LAEQGVVVIGDVVAQRRVLAAARGGNLGREIELHAIAERDGKDAADGEHPDSVRQEQPKTINKKRAVFVTNYDETSRQITPAKRPGEDPEFAGVILSFFPAGDEAFRAKIGYFFASASG
jgi:hypothetical protein